MEAAWIGVIGGAVGAGGTLLGSIATTVLGQRGARRDRAQERERDIQDRWFEERRQLYLDLIEFATEAYEASQELTFRDVTPERR